MCECRREKVMTSCERRQVSEAARTRKGEGRVIVMGISELCENETEARRHYLAIRNLSKELKIPVEILTESYENKLKEIQKTAKVKDYIVLVVMHEVRETLKGVVSV